MTRQGELNMWKRTIPVCWADGSNTWHANVPESDNQEEVARRAMAEYMAVRDGLTEQAVKAGWLPAVRLKRDAHAAPGFVVYVEVDACYSDHNEDINIRGRCDYCHGTETQ